MLVVFPYIGSENYGICCLSAMLKSKGIEVKLAFEPSLFDDTKFLHFNSIPKLFNYNEKFVNYIVSLKPNILAFSVFTSNYLWALDIAGRIKNKIDVITVFGGVHVQSVPRRVLANPQVDYVITGEADYALLDLVQSIGSGKVDQSLPNLGYKNGSEIVINPARNLIENLDILPFADRDIFSKVEDYCESMLYLCGRGCVYNCTYCSTPMLRHQYSNKNKYARFKSVDMCFEELKHLIKKYNPKTFHILDDVFVLNQNWLNEFCLRYSKEIGVPFQVTGYPTLINERNIRLLKDAGCIFLQIGVQSLNANNRKNILKRHESNNDVANCIKLCKAYGMGVSIDYIFFPWEKNEEDQLNAARFFHKNSPSRIANFYLSYLPNTKIVDYAFKHNYINEKDLTDIENGTKAYYHAGGTFLSRKNDLKFFNNFYIFFILLIILPKSIGNFLFKIKFYKYSRFIPKIFLLIFKEYILTIFSSKFRESPAFIKYAKYYFKNIQVMLLGKYR